MSHLASTIFPPQALALPSRKIFFPPTQHNIALLQNLLPQVSQILADQGPARVQVASRQELLLENERLKKLLGSHKAAEIQAKRSLEKCVADLRTEQQIGQKLEAQMRDAIEDMQDVQLARERGRQEKIDLELRLAKEYEDTIRALATECEADRIRIAELEQKLSDEEKSKQLMAQVEKFASARREAEMSGEKVRKELAEKVAECEKVEEMLEQERAKVKEAEVERKSLE